MMVGHGKSAFVSQVNGALRLDNPLLNNLLDSAFRKFTKQTPTLPKKPSTDCAYFTD